jgi:hypothetical protein
VEREDNEDMPQAVAAIDTIDSSTQYLPPPNAITMTTAQMLSLRKAGYSYEQIAKAAGCSKQGVWLRLNGFNKEQVEVEEFRNSEADVLTGLRLRIVKTLDEKAIKNMAPRDRVMAYGILYDKFRLETGQSTSHVVMTHELKLDRSRYTDRMLVDAIDVTPEVSK